MYVYLSLILLTFTFCAPAQQVAEKDLASSSYHDDFIDTVKLIGEGALAQFKSENNLYALSFFAPATWYGFEHDKRLNQSLRKKDYGGWVKVVSDSSVLMSFPLVPLTTYYVGKNNGNGKLVQFSMEFVASIYLALAESGLISLINIHQRPRTDETNFWEEAFRGKSSFPSGHVIPYSVLTFKLLQFYGPYAAIFPAAATIVVAFERVQSEKHWSSDVIAGIGLSYFASQGVSLAAKKRLGDQQKITGGIIQYQDSYGPKIVFHF